MDGHSAVSGASSMGGGSAGDCVGSRADLVSTTEHLLYAGAVNLHRRPMWAVFVGFGRVVWHLFYCSGLKGPTSTELFVSFPFPKTCVVSATRQPRPSGGLSSAGLPRIPAVERLA